MGYYDSIDNTNKSCISGVSISSAKGDFSIGPFRAPPDATPGYWFVVLDSELASTPNVNPITISGDIVYWYEKYDANQASLDEEVFIPIANESSAYESYYSDPVFKVEKFTEDNIYDPQAATPWNLPKWYPINRYTQYSLGFFGTTPNYVTSYQNLHPDYEED
jgi:hypothetical protein